MDFNEFVEKYNSIVPNKKTLINLGYPESISDEFSRKIVSKPPLPIWNYHKDPIVGLLNNFHLEGLEMGMIYFNGGIQELDDFYFFGKIEADPLAINKSSKEILYFEVGNSNILGRCALNSFKFLDALFSLHKTLTTILLKKLDTENEQNFVCNAANSCSELAGGNAYKYFYDLILGCN